MIARPRILAFSGSARQGSYNQQLVALAADLCRAEGAEVTVISLRDFPLPLYNEDEEKATGIPATALELKRLFKSHQALLIASPEYNSALSPLLKNTLDWVSRQTEDEGPLACYQGKVAAVMAASPGGLGGLRGLVSVRSILENIGVLVIPQQVAVSKVHDAWTPDGQFKDATTGNLLQSACKSLVQTTRQLIYSPALVG